MIMMDFTKLLVSLPDRCNVVLSVCPLLSIYVAENHEHIKSSLCSTYLPTINVECLLLEMLNAKCLAMTKGLSCLSC